MLPETAASARPGQLLGCHTQTSPPSVLAFDVGGGEGAAFLVYELMGSAGLVTAHPSAYPPHPAGLQAPLQGRRKL